MKIDFLPEPELQFGAGRHIDVRFGLMNHGPFDVASALAPKQIRMGLVGTSFTVDGARRWFERTGRGVAAKPSNRPNLFPRFPGFGPASPFQSALVFDATRIREVSQKVLDRLLKGARRNDAVVGATDLFLEELRDLAEKGNVDVLLCAVPPGVQELMDRDWSSSDTPGDVEGDYAAAKVPLDFRDLLKARAMELRIPLQLILPSTYDERVKRRVRTDDDGRQVQDEATRAWNIHTALYYKAGGIPWRLVRDLAQLETCYVGVSFYRSLDGSALRTSLAQVFDERGEGVIVRGGPAALSKDDRQPHLSADDARKILEHVLATYRREHRHLPARIVLYKSSPYTEDEVAGFGDALEVQRVDTCDFLNIYPSYIRLFRLGAYPPLRGTLLEIDHHDHVLYTRGSVDFFATYPGMYVPLPLGFRCEEVEQSPRFLGAEILALTKMNWNVTQFDGRDPITLRAAQQVGDILRYLADDEPYESRYAYYM